jgi:hypothetical protein
LQTRAQSVAGFDFTFHMRRLCDDMVARLDVLSHIDMNRVAIRFCQTRKPVQYGMQASLTPLRFAGGATHSQRRSGRYTIQPLRDEGGREMLYLLSFYLPRLLDRPFEDKLNTVIHELWHIGPEFDGDVRRHTGRCYAHSHSKEVYDEGIERLRKAWQNFNPPDDVYAFLRLNYRELTRQHGPVFGHRIPTPRLIRVG